MYYYGIDWTYIVFVLPAVLLALWAQLNVKTTFSKYSRVQSKSGVTASYVARKILDDHGLGNVSIERVSGELSDHYDPKSNTIRLSESVYGSTSVAAIGVAAHEAGHAIQYSESYGPIKFRAAIIPITNIGSNLAFPLVILGIVLSFPPLAYIGVAAFGLSVLFQLVTLPVEFDASKRAVYSVELLHALTDEELTGSKRVLRAAALTYLAALFVALANLLRIILIAGRSKKR